MTKSRSSTHSKSFTTRRILTGAFVLVFAGLSLSTSLVAQSRLPKGKESIARTELAPDQGTATVAQGQVTVMVEMNERPAALVYAEAYKVAQADADAAAMKEAREIAANRSTARSRGVLAPKTREKVQISAAAAVQVKTHREQVDAAQRVLEPSLTAPNIGGQVLYRVQRAYNGIALLVRADKISEIAKLPGVKSVRVMKPLTPDAFNDIDFLGTRAFWTKSVPFGGVHGENVRVAVIDSGLDYIHTNFGGPGTAAAYASVSDTGPVPNAHFPSAKVPSGFDFAGDNYNANGTAAQQIPSPDPNPFDGAASGGSAGHGTSCASLVAGYGVNFGGFTYFGSYGGPGNPDIGAMRISPGFAPVAKLIPLRVFGNSGSTNLVSQAIDYALDPNDDGDFSDRVDVISMSLGSRQGSADDDSAIASSNAAASGIVVVASAGNNADNYYVTGSPGTATGIISVAASFNDQAGFIADAYLVANSGAIAGNKYPGVFTTNSSRGTVTNDVVKLEPNNSPAGTTPVSNAANIAGKIAYVDRVPGQGANAARRAKTAGAIGLIYGADTTGNAGFAFLLNTGTSTPQIPELVITLSDANSIKSYAQFDPTPGPNQGRPANPLNMTIRPAAEDEPKVISGTSTVADTHPGYSSRGPRSGDSVLKPDLTAPAEVVGVALNRAGNQVRNFNGTSSSCPHVAGAMALMKQLHPTWSVDELNALAINTSTHDIFTTQPGPSPSPTPAIQSGVGRVGGGRVDFAKAAQANVIAFNGTDPHLVSVSFGVVEVPVDSDITLSKDIIVRNKGTAAVDYNLTYQSVNELTGADFTFPGGASFSVPAGGDVTVSVELAATGNLLKHVRETSVAATQGGNGRQYLTEKTGYAVFTPMSEIEPVIRVALYAAPKPVSSMRATVTGVVPTAPTGQFTVFLTGSDVFTGLPPSGPIVPDIISLMKPFELQYTSPQAGLPSAPSDPDSIKFVGITSDYSTYVSPSATPPNNNPNLTTISFVVEAFGDASTPTVLASDREILIDTDQNGTFDFVLYGSTAAGLSSPNNVYVPVVQNLTNNQAATTGYFTNVFPGNSIDTNTYNNSAIVYSIDAIIAPFTGFAGFNVFDGGSPAFNYQVVTFNGNGEEVDTTPVMTYDISKPGLDATDGGFEPSMLDDFPGFSFPVNYNGSNYQANGSLGLLLVHMHNGSGNRSEVIAFRKPLIKAFSPVSGPVGTQVRIAGANFGPGTQVRFFNNKVAQINVLSANTLIATVPPGAITGPIRVSNAAGSSTSQGVFTVTAGPGASPSPSPSPDPSPTRVSARQR